MGVRSILSGKPQRYYVLSAQGQCGDGGGDTGAGGEGDGGSEGQ